MHDVYTQGVSQNKHDYDAAAAPLGYYTELCVVYECCMALPQRVLCIILRFTWCPVYVVSPVSAAVSTYVLNGGRQCMCAIADTLLNGVRGCGHSVAAPVRLTNRIVAT